MPHIGPLPFYHRTFKVALNTVDVPNRTAWKTHLQTEIKNRQSHNLPLLQYEIREDSVELWWPNPFWSGVFMEPARVARPGGGERGDLYDVAVTVLLVGMVNGVSGTARLRPDKGNAAVWRPEEPPRELPWSGFFS